MTVIEFKKRDFNNKIILTMLVLGIGAAFIGGIFLYNTVVALRHDIATKTENLEQAQVQNAELKNEMYRYLDDTNQELFLQSRGLVIEKNPHYASVSKASTVASQQP